MRYCSKICGDACFALDEIKSLRQKSLRRKFACGLLFANNQHTPTMEQMLVMLFEDHGQMTLDQLKMVNRALDQADVDVVNKAKYMSHSIFNAVVPCRITDSAKAASPCLFRYATFLKKGVNRTTCAEMDEFLLTNGDRRHNGELMRLFKSHLTKESWWWGHEGRAPPPPTPLRGFDHGVTFINLLIEMSLEHPDVDRLIAFASVLIYFWGQKGAQFLLDRPVSHMYPHLMNTALRHLGDDAIEHLGRPKGRASYYTLLFGLLLLNARSEEHKEEIRQTVRLLSRGGDGTYAKMEKVLPLALMDVVLRHRGVDLGKSALTGVPAGYYTPAECPLKSIALDAEVWDRLDDEEVAAFEEEERGTFKLPDWVVDKHTFRGRTGKRIPREWALMHCDDKAAFEALSKEEEEERLGPKGKKGLNAFMSEGVATFAGLHPMNDPFFDKVQYLKGGTFGHVEWIHQTSFYGIMDHFAKKATLPK